MAIEPPIEMPPEERHHHDYQSIIPDKKNYSARNLIYGLEWLTYKILVNPVDLDGDRVIARFNNFKSLWPKEQEHLEKMSLDGLREFIESKGYSVGEVLQVYTDSVGAGRPSKRGIAKSDDGSTYLTWP